MTELISQQMRSEKILRNVTFISELRINASLVYSMVTFLSTKKHKESKKMEPINPTYTPTPTFIIDLWLPLLSESEIKILLVILRRTLALQKDYTDLSMTQLYRLTGCSKSTLARNIKSLKEKQLLMTEVHGDPGYQTTYYKLILRYNVS